MSEEYSKPGFNILILLMRFIVVESGTKLAFTPWVDAILTKDGKLFYPIPP